MTRSIFDPTGGETEHSGSRNLGPDASEISQMPPDIVDGVVDPDEARATVDMEPTPCRTPSEGDAVDAPQEPEALEDPDAMMEGQYSDENDAPQQ